MIRLGDAQADLSVRWAHVILWRLKLSVCEMSCVRVLVRLCAFSTRNIWWPFGGGSVLGVRAAKGLSRPFQADLVTNLIKQGEIVTERHCCYVAQWSEWSRPGFKFRLGHLLFPPL